MSRFKDKADQKTESSFALLNKKLGRVPNIYKAMAASPAVLEGHLAFSGALSKGVLTAAEKEHIALALAGFNHCEYCASAHTMLAAKAGIEKTEIANNLKSKSSSAKVESLIHFCLLVLEKKGNVSDLELQAIRAAGFSDEAIVEIIATICLNLFTNYFNNVAATEIDFPLVSLD